ncbi:glycosyltransferase [Anaeromicropila herbilytica]|uniref:Glycosyl transferase n=1 Tax=Anaeromicropila herbilytica TaxID=2785025 RepID=A0A7R7EHW5_9FIRM|nr:glycosyltransferase [Anaeromicropila herbilytica]BCN29015.1 glycosyl transferase [Anaeromicropila herbilytica]
MVNVSIIVPVYNTEKYLQRCLDSLVNQTLEELEIILIDDGSIDTSNQIMREYEKEYPNRVKVYTKENGGQATARNMGVLKSSGKYIGFVDSDDYVDTSMFESMYQMAEEEKCDMVECHYHYLCEEGKAIKEYKARGNVRQFKNQKDMFINPQVSPWNKLYRREVLMHSGVDFPDGYIYEDTAFYIKTIPFIKKEKYIDEQFVYYYLRGNSTMNVNKSRRVGDIIPVMENILDFYINNQLYDVYQEELEYFCVKTLLCSSLSRIGRIKDHSIAKELYDNTFSFINERFPNYKHNQYFSGKIGIYSRLVNRRNSKYIGKVLGFVLKG